MEFVRGLFQYLKDEWKDKKMGGDFPNADEWQLISTTGETPMQHNGFDCGVFTCIFADFISMGYDVAFNQEHINKCRNLIALSIARNCIATS